MSSPESTDAPLTTLAAQRLSYVVLACAVALYAQLARIMAPYLPDDPFISYRYADNLGSGAGLTFNPGQPPVEGYSNFLWILIASVVRRLGLDIVYWMPRLGALTGMLAVVLVWAFYRRRGVTPGRMLLPLALFASSGPLVLYSVSGFETPLVAALLAALILSLDSVVRTDSVPAWVALTVCGVLLIVTRPEGVVAFPVVVGFCVASRVGGAGHRVGAYSLRRAVAAGTAFAGALGVYTFWRGLYFGQFLPTPFVSKGGAGQDLGTAWRMNREMYFEQQGFGEVAIPPFGYYYLALALFGLGGLLASRGSRSEQLVDRAAMVLAVLLALVYTNFVDWYPAMRYHSGLIPLFFLPAVWLLPRCSGGTPPPGSRPGLAVLGISGMVCLNLFVFMTAKVETRESEAFHDRLMALADWLRETPAVGDVLATPDVGIVPYYSRLEIIDIHPEALVDGHVAANGFSEDYFFSRDPSAVLLTTRRGRLFRETERGLVESPRFRARYRRAATIQLRWFEDLSYWLYIRSDAELSGEDLERLPEGIDGG